MKSRTQQSQFATWKDQISSQKNSTHGQLGGWATGITLHTAVAYVEYFEHAIIMSDSAPRMGHYALSYVCLSVCLSLSLSLSFSLLRI